MRSGDVVRPKWRLAERNEVEEPELEVTSQACERISQRDGWSEENGIHEGLVIRTK